MPNGPKPILEQTLKTYYKGQMILKMPLSSGGGNLYFTKTDHLEVQFIRIVSADDQINRPFNGYYEFINMNTYEYKKVIFKKGLRQAEVNNSLPKQQTIKNNSTIKSTETWLGTFLYCLSKYVFAMPKRDSNGDWGCNVLGGGSDGEVSNLAPPESGSGGLGGDGPVITIGGGAGPGIDWFNWFNSINWPGLPPSYPDGGVNTGGDGSWSTFIGDGGNYLSNPTEGIFLQSIYDNIPPLITWEFQADDGSLFIDNTPNIEPPLDFHPMDLSYIKFPKFVNLVKNLRSFVKGNPKVLNALQKWSGFSKQEILEKLILRLGSGPEILVSDAVGPNYGKYNHQIARGVLFIDPITVNNFQQAQQSSKEEDALAFMLSIIILHEFTHFGINSMGLLNTGRFKFVETGREFERMLFDVILIDGPNGNLNEVYIEFVKK